MSLFDKALGKQEEKPPVDPLIKGIQQAPRPGIEQTHTTTMDEQGVTHYAPRPEPQAQAPDAWPRQEVNPVQESVPQPSPQPVSPPVAEPIPSPVPVQDEATEREKAFYMAGVEDGARATKKKIMDALL